LTPIPVTESFLFPEFFLSACTAAVARLYELPSAAKRSISKDRRLYQNGNLYFSADILFPRAIYYLYTLQAIIDVPCPSSWFENIDFDYDELRAECDSALIQYFVQLLWKCVKTLLPSDVFHAVWEYTRAFNHTDFYITFPDLYLEWLCQYWANAAKSRETRASLLPMLFLELTPVSSEDEDDLLENNSDGSINDNNSYTADILYSSLPKATSVWLCWDS
jgi:hypothetical protein